MNEQQIYGYVRVSSKEQNTDRQVIALQEFGVPSDAILIERMSGKDFNRPIYQELVQNLKPGDTLVIKSIDRLGRDYEEIINQWRHITKVADAAIVVIDMPLLDTRINKDLMGTFIADLVLQILSFVSEGERHFIRTRQKEGIAAAKARGVRFGHPIKKSPENFGKIVRQWERGKIPFSEVLIQTGLKQATFYNRLREHRKAGK